MVIATSCPSGMNLPASCRQRKMMDWRKADMDMVVCTTVVKMVSLEL